jgi:fructokinase
VELSDTGERKFAFARKPGADTTLSFNEVKQDIVNSCGIFHFGSLSLTDQPARGATIEAIQSARRAGAIISYDPNYRAPLWKTRAEAVENMRAVLGLADIIKISDEETGLITGKTAPEEAASYLLQTGISCAVVTLGKKGAYAAIKDAGVYVPVPDVPVVDTTGAGDAFWGGFLYKLAVGGLHPNKLGKTDLKEYVIFANAVAALCVQKRGGMPAADEVSGFLLDSDMKF